MKHLPTVKKTRIQFLDGEDLLEEEMAIHSGIRAWRIPWTEEPGGLQSTGSHRVRHSLVVTKPPAHPTGKSELEVPPPSVFRALWALTPPGTWSLSHWTTREVPAGRSHAGSFRFLVCLLGEAEVTLPRAAGNEAGMTSPMQSAASKDLVRYLGIPWWSNG